MTRKSSTKTTSAATPLPPTQRVTCPHPSIARTSPGGVCPICTPPTTAPRRTRLGVAERALLVQSFADFFRAGWHVLEASTPLSWGWALESVCEHLQAVIEDWARRQAEPTFIQRIRDLLCTLPPGTAKSRATVYLIPWAWLRWPQLRCLALSANPRVALRDSMYSRDVIASDWYQRTFRLQWRIRDDSDGKELFSNSAGGFRAAHGWDARVVGTRGDLILVDDPHDPEEAASDAQRAAVHERWDSAIANRTNDVASSVRIGIAQRSHEDDWSARRIAEGWAHLDLPMLHEPERGCITPLGKPDTRTVEGEPIDPVRFPPEELAKIRTAVGERRWATLYQGRPAPAGGALVETAWLRFWRRPDQPDAASARPRGCWTGPSRILDLEDARQKRLHVVIAADLAGGKKTVAGDYNVIVVVGRRGPDFFLLDTWRERADFPDVIEAIRARHERFPRAATIIEQAASGAPLVATLQREIPGVISQPPRGDKVSRVESVLHYFRGGNVHLPEHWTGTFGLDGAVAELTTFPNCRFDDFTDALQIAVAYLADKGAPSKWSKRDDVPVVEKPKAPKPQVTRIGNYVDRGDGRGFQLELPYAAIAFRPKW